MLFKIDGTETSIVGTHHALPASEPTLSPEVWRAVEAAELIALERDPLDAGDGGVGQLSAFENLADYVEVDLLERVVAKWQSLSCQGDVSTLKPWWAAMQITQKILADAGYKTALGVDPQIAQKVPREKMIALEKLSDALQAFEKSPRKEQIGFLEHALRARPIVEAEMHDLYRAWRAGDLDFFAENVAGQKKLFPIFFARLLGARNRQWLPRMIKIIESRRPAIIAFGAAHLIGEDGIKEMLNKHGYSLTFQK